MLTHLPTIYLDSDRPVCYSITPDNEKHFYMLDSYNFKEIKFTYPGDCYSNIKVFHAFRNPGLDTRWDMVVFIIDDPDCYDIRCRLLIDLAFKSIITEGNDQFSFELKDGLGYLRLV